MATATKREDMNIVIVGHVDHGKSTVIGRLLADTDSLPEGKLDAIRELCRRTSKPFEYAFLLDALKDERAQGITIDAARCFFKTAARNYTILDAPGHIEFLRNMVTGAARAQAALLVIDAKEGVRENSRRHGYMLSILGIRQIAVVINKMDLVGFSKETFETIRKEYTAFLERLGIVPKFVLPVSAFCGDNIRDPGVNMPWYEGTTVLETLDLFENERDDVHHFFRMPVQDVYKFTSGGDDRRIIAGTVCTGRIEVGDDVVFFPSGKTSRIRSVESFPTGPAAFAEAGAATGVTLEEQIYVTRGEVMARKDEPMPHVSTRLEASIFWLGKKDFREGQEYTLKLESKKVRVTPEKIRSILDSGSLAKRKRDRVRQNEAADCILKTEKPIAFDTANQNASTGRFVLVDGYEIVGGGIITASLPDDRSELKTRVSIRNSKWESGWVNPSMRAEKYGQKPILFILTGGADAGKKDLAKAFESQLVRCGHIAYFLGIGTFLYGVDSDMKLSGNNIREEHIRRFGEVANLMLDAGMILIVTARNMTQADLEIMKTVITGDVAVMWVGKERMTDIFADLCFPDAYNPENLVKMNEHLAHYGVIFERRGESL
ncbi:MAG: adenylyl-sulfate kinase [Clostridiaceae bacterium]|nr:adenylyl-sulfate kinase [Clostridiaceae bacterium]